MKTRASTAREIARTSKDFLLKKSTKLPASELSRVKEEQDEWENEVLHPLMVNNNNNNRKDTRMKTPLVLEGWLTQRKEAWLGNKQSKSEETPKKNQASPDYSRTTHLRVQNHFQSQKEI